MSPQSSWALLLFWVDPGEDRKRAACRRYRNLSPFGVCLKAGYNLIGFNRKVLMDDDRPVTRRDLNELKQELKQEMKHLADSMTEPMRDIETKMLTAFHGYAKGTGARIQRTEISEAANAARIEALEDRVLELETRQGR
jgi:hypothetical protein